MKKQPLIYGLALTLAICLSLLTSPARGADLSRMDLGSYVTGPKITNADLKGRFVIVEYWGVNCGPCIASIPHMTKLAKDYGHDRLVIVANHCQAASDEKAKEVWESRAKSNYVAVINRGNLPGANVSGIPDSFLFDPTGKLIWRGQPTSVDKPLEKAMKSFRWPKKEKQEKKEEPAPDPIVPGVTSKYYERQVEDINAQKRSIDRPLAQIRRAAERGKEEQVAEAKAILDVVTQWATTQQANINSTMSSDPAKAYAMSEQFIELLGRDDLAKVFVEIKKTMDTDDALMDRVRSMRMLREVIAQAESIGLTEDLEEAKSNRRNSRDLRVIARDLGRIADKWPETEAGKQAKTLQAEWGLDD